MFILDNKLNIFFSYIFFRKTKQEEHHAEQNFSLQAVRSLMELLFVKKQRVVRLLPLNIKTYN